MAGRFDDVKATATEVAPLWKSAGHHPTMVEQVIQEVKAPRKPARKREQVELSTPEQEMPTEVTPLGESAKRHPTMVERYIQEIRAPKKKPEHKWGQVKPPTPGE